MGKPIYITDPIVAAAYHVHPGEWAYVPDDVEAAWLVSTRHGYSIDRPSPPPAAYYVHPSAPLPFVPFGTPSPSPPPSSPPPSPRGARLTRAAMSAAAPPPADESAGARAEENEP